MSQTTLPLDLKNVQGDILLGGFPKKAEIYLFFRTEDARVKEFRQQLKELLPHISSGADVVGDRNKIIDHKRNDADKEKLLKLCGVNIAFSQKGLKQLGFNVDGEDKIGDDPFQGGMFNDNALNDHHDKWFPEFKEDIHGLIIIAGDSSATVTERLDKIQKILQDTIHVVKRADGHVRPKEEEGHEHFGYLDGVSQPGVLGVDGSVNRGQELVRQGIILLGREGDEDGAQPFPQPIPRPSWALDGSFLTFRYMSQLVPEFQGFVDQNNHPDAPKDHLGARLVGRWKSGAPVDVTPLKDDPELGGDGARNDDFRYDPLSQDRCPFAAHTRKTNPRSDLPSTEIRHIIRHGIQFGPEVNDDEKKNGTKQDRGLLFKCYSSNNVHGFQFIQSSWANNPNFPFLRNPQTPKPGFNAQRGPGVDPIISQAPGDGTGARDIVLTNANDPQGNLNLPVEWVVTKGGEYFFSPSIPALEKKFSLAK